VRQGYLLERLGDVAAALGIACAAAERANAALIAGIRDGSVPLRALPAPARARCARAGGVFYPPYPLMSNAGPLDVGMLRPRAMKAQPMRALRKAQRWPATSVRCKGTHRCMS
jgi:hypothetical protein